MSSENGLAMLSHVAQQLDAATSSLLEARSLFSHDLSFVDEALRDAARDGATPGSLAASHLVASGGKRVRALAVLLCASCFGPVPQSARQLALVAEMVHAATLLHDDVIDDSDTRRGLSTARTIYGNAVSILAGDLLLTHALDRTAQAAPETLSDLLVTLRRLVDGEIIQLRGRRELDLSPATYHRIVAGKTASLFGWAARSGAKVGGGSTDAQDRCAAFGEHLGTAFQLVDDVLDYEGDPSVTGKSLLADLAEGKVTLPLLLAVEKDSSLISSVHAVREGDADAARSLGSGSRIGGMPRFDVAHPRRRHPRVHTLVEPARFSLSHASRSRCGRAHLTRFMTLPQHSDDTERESLDEEPSGTQGLWPSEVLVSDVVGRLIEFWGFKRNMGRVWAVLYLNEAPLTAPDLRDRLCLSAGAISMTLAELTRWGVVKKVWVQGDRRDHRRRGATVENDLASVGRA
ncbi:MAG: polyprenyl synthetase family protein [Polyangiaceae bacterium]